VVGVTYFIILKKKEKTRYYYIKIKKFKKNMKMKCKKCNKELIIRCLEYVIKDTPNTNNDEHKLQAKKSNNTYEVLMCCPFCTFCTKVQYLQR
jgi:hypothetical protein